MKLPRILRRCDPVLCHDVERVLDPLGRQPHDLRVPRCVHGLVHHDDAGVLQEDAVQLAGVGVPQVHAAKVIAHVGRDASLSLGDK